MLGSHLLLDLLLSGCKVRACKRTTSKVEIVKKIFSFYTDKSEELFENIEWCDADMLDYDSIYEAMNGVDVVYHCAATVSFNPKFKEQMIKNNVEGTANIVNSALQHGIKKLCHVSSIAALQSTKNNKLIDEDIIRTNNEKISAYSVSKLKSELEVWRGIAEGLNAIIVNPSVIIGAGNWNNGSPRLIKTVNKGLKFYTKGSTGFVDVRDTVKIMIKLTNSNISSERYIINAENIPYRTIFDEIAKNLNKKKPSIYAGNFILQTVLILESIAYKLFGKEPKITKDTIISAKSKSRYSNKKIKNTLDYKFIDIKKSISDVCKIFKNDNE